MYEFVLTNQITTNKDDDVLIGDDTNYIKISSTGVLSLHGNASLPTSKVGDLTGNVTGDLTGDVEGDVTGDVLADDDAKIIDSGADIANSTVTAGNFVGDLTGKAKQIGDGADPVNAASASNILTITATPTHGESFVIGSETFDIHGDNVTAYEGANTEVDITAAATAAQATEILTIDGVVLQGETVTVGTDIYEFDLDGTATGRAVDVSSYATASQGVLTVSALDIHDDTLVVAGTTTTLKADGTAGSATVIDIEQAATSARATTVLTVSGVPLEGEIFTIGTRTYEFDPAANGVGSDVAILSAAAVTVPLICDQIETDYNADGSASAVAVSDGISTVTFTQKIAGVAGNVASTNTMPYSAFTGANFVNGAAPTAAELAALVYAHYASGGAGEEATVLATASDSTTVTFTAVALGTAGDAITTTHTLTAGSFDAVTLGTATPGVDCSAANAQIALSAATDVTGLLAAQPYSFGAWATNAATLTMHNVGIEGNGIAIEETGVNMAWTGGDGVTDGGVDATNAELEAILAALTPTADVTLAVDGEVTTTINATADTPGTADNAIATTSAATGLTWASATLTGGVDGTIGLVGEVRYNSTNLYICTAANTVVDSNWVKATLVSVPQTITEHGVGAIGTSAGITTTRVEEDGVIVTSIKIDLAGLASVATANDVIGLAAGGIAYIGRNKVSNNGVIFKAEFSCIETPVGGDDDVNVVTNASGTLAYDGAGGTSYISNSGDLLAGQTIQNLLPAITANDFFYLTAGTGDVAAAYTAGQYLLKLYGHALLS